MPWKCLCILFFAISSFGMAASPDEKFTQLKQELGLNEAQPVQLNENVCHLYLVHHGDTDWSIGDNHLQGWSDISLNDLGRQQVNELAEELADLKIDAIYTSSLNRSVESAEILQKGHDCEIIKVDDLRGEAHGNLDGLAKEEYSQDPHYIEYKSLSAVEKIFCPVGKGGLSKADVARTSIPVLKDICRKHPGQNVIVVVHGGILKFLNFMYGNYELDHITQVPHGRCMRIDCDGNSLVLHTDLPNQPGVAAGS